MRELQCALDEQVEKLREEPVFEERDVTSMVVSKYLERNPPYVFRHLQEFLQSPITQYLRELVEVDVVCNDLL